MDKRRPKKPIIKISFVVYVNVNDSGYLNADRNESRIYDVNVSVYFDRN